jgi:hypothetical protein
MDIAVGVWAGVMGLKSDKLRKTCAAEIVK